MFCRSLFVPLYFFFWPLCCLFFFDILILIAPLVSSNSSYSLRRTNGIQIRIKLLYSSRHTFCIIKWTMQNIITSSNCITFKGYCNKFNHAILTSVIRLMNANQFLLFRQLLVDIFVEEWNVLAQFNKFTGTVQLGFKLLGEKVELNFKDLVMASLEIYMSIGGEF